MGLYTTVKSMLTKQNPIQPIIAQENASEVSSNRRKVTTTRAFRDVDIFNRCVNLLVDNASRVTYDVQDQHSFRPLASLPQGGIRQERVNTLLNVRPNPYMDISTFWRLVLMDFILEGWAFVYWDGASLFHVPAAQMEVFNSTSTAGVVDRYVYDGRISYSPDEIIFFKDNAYNLGESTQIAGQSRILSILSGIDRREKLLSFKENFFDNGAVIGAVLETDNVLGRKQKERYTRELSMNYNRRTGRHSFLVLDNGFKLRNTAPTSTRDLDVTAEVESFDRRIALALGIPYVLLESGNNANIRPNIELLYYNAILPMMAKFEKSIELFFGYDVKLMTTSIEALAPDQEQEASSLAALVNNGIITGNEAREQLRLDPLDDPQMTAIRIPQNVAGSATGVAGQEGGAPPSETEDN